MPSGCNDRALAHIRHVREHKCIKEPRQPPHSPHLEAFLLIAAVAHMIIRLRDLSLPLPFSWSGEIVLFYKDLIFGH